MSDLRVSSRSDVDRLCREIFLSPSARERDDNLIFVRERLLRSGGDRTSLLDLYGRVWKGRRVVDDKANRLVDILRLAGITRSEHGCLRVRNRIYARVFNRAWIIENMPDAELRRQRAAYWRGVLRAAAVFAVILAIMGGVALAAVRQARAARRATLREARQRLAAQEGQRMLRRQLYASQMGQVEQALAMADQRGALELLDAWRPVRGQEDLRGWEWRYFWRQARGIPVGPALSTGQGPIGCIVFSPDGRILVTGGSDGTVKLRHPQSLREWAVWKGHTRKVTSASFTREGRTLATGSVDGTVRLWNVKSGRSETVLNAHSGGVTFVGLTPVGKRLVTAGGDQQVKLWDPAAHRAPVTLERIRSAAISLALSPDGQLLAVSEWSTVRLWDLRRRRVVASLEGQDVVEALAFSPDGKRLAAAEGEGTPVIRLWDLTGLPPKVGAHVSATLLGHRGPISALAFSPDGRWLASSAWDATIRLWSMKTRQEAAVFRGHWGSNDCLAFSKDGQTLIARDMGDVIRVWQTGKPPVDLLGRHRTPVLHALTFSRNGRRLASAEAGGLIKLWDVTARREVARFRTDLSRVGELALSPDGKTLAAGNDDQRVEVGNTATRRQITILQG